MVIRYKIPSEVCLYDRDKWQKEAEKRGIGFDKSPKPICIRDIDTGQYIIIQEVEDSGNSGGDMAFN